MAESNEMKDYDPDELSQPSHPNRATRRAAQQNGYELPIIQVMLFPDGRVKIDSHKDVTGAQIREFLQQMIDMVKSD